MLALDHVIIAGADHPARTAAAHSVAAPGSSRIRIGGDPAAVAQRLGSEVRGLEVEPGEPGVGEVVIAATTGPIAIT